MSHSLPLVLLATPAARALTTFLGVYDRRSLGKVRIGVESRLKCVQLLRNLTASPTLHFVSHM